MHKLIAFFAAVLVIPFTACNAQEAGNDAGYGYNPQLPSPQSSLIPTLNVADAKGWPQGLKPIPAPEFSVQSFAQGLEHPRWIYVLPNGDVLVAETDAPPKPEDGK